MQERARELIEIAFKIGALKVSVDKPFTWASGSKMPVYLDNRALLSLPASRILIMSSLEDLVSEGKTPESFCGCATGGIAPAACLAEKFGKQFNYVRSGKKAHGLGKQVEGLPVDGLDTLIVEDLISTGGSSVAVVDAARDAGAKVEKVFSIFNYGFPEARELAQKKSIELKSVLGFDELFVHSQEQNLLNTKQLELLERWRENPFEWWSQVNDTERA